MTKRALISDKSRLKLAAQEQQLRRGSSTNQNILLQQQNNSMSSGCVNVKFGQENNSITESSVDQEAANSQSDNEHLSVIDRYDLKASEFRQYFPQPPAAKSVEDELEEAREKLGLKKMKT